MDHAHAQAFSRAAAGRNSVVGVLDIGTAKVCCLIADIAGPPRLLGFGHQRSRGIKAGIVVDLAEAEQAVRAAVAQAERQAGTTLDGIRVSLVGGQLQSIHFAASASVHGGVVRADDVTRVTTGARDYCERDGRTLAQMNRISYRLDDYSGINNPLGLAGHTLAGQMHAVTADDGPVRNLSHLIDRCYLRAAAFVPAGLASASAVTTDEERAGGVTVLDIGAGATSIAVAAAGHDVFAASIPMGGNHITFDIMSALGTSFAEAERIKVLYGTMVEAASDEHDFITFPRAGEVELCRTTRAQVRNIIRPRMERLLAQAAEKVVGSGLQGYGGDRLVLTGGSAQLVGLSVFAGRHLSCSVRVAGPRALSGMASSACIPAFATAVGMIMSAADGDIVPLRGEIESASRGGYLGRVGQWLREAF